MLVHAGTTQEIMEELKTGPEGLSTAEAEQRLHQYGKNQLAEPPKKNALEKIWEQIRDPMVLILIAAAVVSGLLGEVADMCIILMVVLMNTILGLVQENKAEQAVEALKKMSAQSARVERDGHIMTLPTEELVPGDLVLLDAGDLVPADLRLIESSSLKIEEASLTGESVPSEKNAQADVPSDAPLGDRVNTAYLGTGVTYGRARGIVAATGMETELGRIAGMISQTPQDTTPLQKKLAEIGKIMTIGVLLICVVIFGVIILKAGSFSSDSMLHAFLIAVSLAVAAIPEGLPAVVTIVMSIGMTIMARRKAIIKKLPAVETLGCAQIICSDKTGTLTQNKMTVRNIYSNLQLKTSEDYLADCGQSLLLNALFLCNDSEITTSGQEIGDPTETCLKRYVLQKYTPADFSSFKRLQDLPFDSDRKMMSTVNQMEDNPMVFAKGAPDELLKKCTHILLDGDMIPLTEAHRAAIMEANQVMAGQALRVLGTACRPWLGGEALETNLTFLGLVGMIDPPRPEAAQAIETCKTAGITTIMITGDHRDTAIAIAKELKILEDPSQAVFGSVLDGMSDEELDQFVPDIRVYARVSPQHKVRIVESWKRLGKVVAMTGDGVNDAPALKTADIGVGMGITGTEVSKGAADLLLADDNFATIVNAVEEGRKIYANIRKAVQFLLSCNISEVLSLFVATLILPAGTIFLDAVHILWINLVTDSIPAIGLGMNRDSENVMLQPPRDSSAGIFSGGVGPAILIQGLFLSLIALGAYFTGARWSQEIAVTMAFTVMSMGQILHSFNIKSGIGTIFRRSTFDNPIMLLGAGIPVLLLLILYVPFLADLFHVVPLNGVQWAASLALAFCIIPLDELYRFMKRRLKSS